jgi:hypothetical protein
LRIRLRKRTGVVDVHSDFSFPLRSGLLAAMNFLLGILPLFADSVNTKERTTNQSSGATPEGESAGLNDLSQRRGNILRRVNKSLHPDTLPQIDRAEMQECFVALEQMKMLISELEIFRLGLK